MMRLLVLLVALAGVGLGAAWLAEVPGELRLEWRGWELRAAAGLMIAAALVLVALLMAGLLCVGFLWRIPGRLAAVWRARREQRGWRSLESGLTAVAGGDERGVRNALKGVQVLPADAPLRLLLEAQAAVLTEDQAGARAVFERMGQDAQTRLAALRGLVDEVRKQGRLEDALALAAQAADGSESPRWAQQACVDLSARLGRWDDAMQAVQRMRRSGHLTEEAARRARGIVAVEVARKRRAERDFAGAQRAASDAVSLVPGFVPAAVMAAEVMLELGRADDAERALRAAWGAHPHPELAFLLLPATGAKDPVDGVALFETLSESASDTMEAHLALAEVALRAELFSMARKSLELVQAGPHDARVYRLLADLERAEGNGPEAAAKWLAAAMDATPAPAWVCSACGGVSERWHAVCDACGAFDRIDWGRAAPAEHDRPVAPKSPRLPVEPAALAGATP